MNNLTKEPERQYAQLRRTQRVQLTIPVVVRGTIAGKTFQEDTHTVTVNANGCLLLLAAKVVPNQKLSIVHPKTAEELPCQVIYLGQSDGSKTQVGIEFAESSPLFWRISFPPEDWDPSQRKRPVSPTTVGANKPKP